MIQDDKKVESYIKFLTRLGMSLLFVALAMPFIIRGLFKSKVKGYTSVADLGTVGDFIGGTTVAFLTASSVILLLATIIMQRKEIKISQQSIEELVKQTAASVEQAEQARKETQITNETMKQQQIESTFFNMLSLHHQIVNSLSFGNDKKSYIGREAISRLKILYENSFGNREYYKQNPDVERVFRINEQTEVIYKRELFGKADSINQEELDEVYKAFHDRYGNLIGHYMRNNYRIVKFIVNNVATDEEEQKRIKEETGREPIIGDIRYYFGTLRAQWSNAEFELILINALYSENHKFKDLIIKYDVLDIQDKDDTSSSFKLKDSMMGRFKAYRKLIESQEEIKEESAV